MGTRVSESSSRIPNVVAFCPYQPCDVLTVLKSVNSDVALQ